MPDGNERVGTQARLNTQRATSSYRAEVSLSLPEWQGRRRLELSLSIRLVHAEEPELQ